MNILEVEDMVKGLPDDRLQQEAEMPTGQVPQFLVVSEIQRRSDMRKRFAERQQQQPQGTVKDQIIQEGIAAMAPPDQSMQAAMMGQQQQMPQEMMPPQGMPMPPEGMPMPPQGMPMEQPPMGMYGGGVVRMYAGQGVPMPKSDFVGSDLIPDDPFGITRRKKDAYEEMIEQIRAGKPLSPTQTKVFTDYDEEFGSEPDITVVEGIVRKTPLVASLGQTGLGGRSSLIDTDEQIQEKTISTAGQTPEEPDILSQQPPAIQSLSESISEITQKDPSSVLQNLDAFTNPELMPNDLTRLTGSNALGEDAKRFNQNADASNVRSAFERDKQARTDLAGRRTQQLEGLEKKYESYAQSVKDMKVPTIDYSSLKAQQQEFAEGQIAEAKKAGAAQALIALGAGIAKGDIGEGLSEAGKATAAANAEKRAIAARNKAAEFGFTRAEIDNEYNRAVKKEENRLRAIELEIGGLEKLGASRFAAEQFAIVSEVPVEQAIATLNQSKELALAKIENDEAKQEELLKREVLRASSSLMKILPATATLKMTPEDMLALQNKLARDIGAEFGLTLDPRGTTEKKSTAEPDSDELFEERIKDLAPEIQEQLRQQRERILAAGG